MTRMALPTPTLHTARLRLRPFAARVLEELGFVREGTLREDCVVNGGL
jgi:hypothetical protein